MTKEEGAPSPKNDDSVATLDKGTLYGGVIVLLVALLSVSVFTGGFGVHAAGGECVECTECQVCPAPGECQVGDTDPYSGVPNLAVSVGDLPALGDANAPATLIEVSDYQCPYCSRFHMQTSAPLKLSHVDTGLLKVHFRDFPLSFHNHAMDAAIAARCANAQGQFWDMNFMLFENQQAWSGAPDVRETFSGYAGDLALDVSAFQACYDSREHEAAINSDMTSASQSGVQGTPGSFIVIPKENVDALSFKSAVSGLQGIYGSDGIRLYQDADNVIVFVGGAYPLDVFTTVLSEVN
ncbi:MAG: thioredoxin domain-containing protein [Candidatus Micrarchaeota archaeon]